MNNALGIARSGLSAAGLRLDSAGRNVANALTPGFRRQQVVQQSVDEGGVSATSLQASEVGSDLAIEMVEQMSALYTFKANLQTVKAHDRMLGSLLDASA